MSIKNINQMKLNSSMKEPDKIKEKQTERSEWKKPEVQELKVAKITHQLTPPEDPMQS